jgi:hypothetical protein
MLERVDSIFDIPAVQKEFAQYISFIKDSKAELSGLFDMLKSFKDTNIANLTKDTEKLSVGMNGTLGATKAAEEANAKLIARIKELEDAMTKMTESQKKGNDESKKRKVATDEEIRTNLQAKEALKARTDAIKAEGSAFAQLRLQYQAAEKTAKDLAAAHGVESKAAQDAVKHAKDLSEKIAAINKATGNQAPNSGVGRYAEGIKEAFSGIKEGIHNLAEGGGEALGGIIGNLSLVAIGAKVVDKAFDFVKEGIKEFEEQQLAVSKLANILNNLGQGKIFGELNEEAEKLSKTFGTFEGREVINSFRQLTTYGKLTKNQMKELEPVIIDFAANAHVSIEEATSTIIKGLEGQGRALKEYGINLDKDGGAVKNFGNIMTQLAPRVAGSAQVLADSFEGTQKKIAVATAEMQEKIGKQLVPTLQKLELGLLAGVEGDIEIVQGYWKTLTDGYDTLIDAFKTAWYWTEKIATGGKNKDLENYERQKALKKQQDESNEAFGKAGEFARSFADQVEEAAKKQSLLTDEYKEAKDPLEQMKVRHELIIRALNNELKAQEAIMNSEIQRYQQLKDTGMLIDKNTGLQTKEGAFAIKRAAESVRIVNALREAIERNEDTGKLNDTGGDGKGKKTQDLSKLRDFAEGYRKILDDIVTYNQKTFQLDLTPLQKDLDSAWNEYDKFFRAVRDLRAKDEKDLDERKADIDKKRKDGDITKAEAEKGYKEIADTRKLIEDKSHQDLTEAEIAYNEAVKAINAKYAKIEEAARKERDRKALENAKKFGEDIAKQNEATAKRNLTDALYGLKTNADFSKSGYETGPNRKDSKAERAIETQIKQQELNGQYDDGKGAMSATEFKYRSKKLTADNTKGDQEDDAKFYNEQIDKVQKYVDTAEDLYGKLQDVKLTKELNAIAETEKAQQKNYEQQVKRINGSTATEEQKAARLKELDAERQIQADQAEQKRRRVEAEKAKFQKAQAITSIIFDTAKGVASALIGDPYTVALRVAVVAAVGAAQLALAIAQPVPTYKLGTKDHKGGPAITGDGYAPELILEPNKAPYWSPDQPTLMNLAKHTRVIPLDQVEDMRAGSMTVNPLGRLVYSNNQTAREMRGVRDAVQENTAMLKRMASNKAVIKNNVKVDVSWSEYIHRNVKS